MTEIRHIGSYFKEIIDVAYHKLVILIFPYGGADMEKKEALKLPFRAI